MSRVKAKFIPLCFEKGRENPEWCWRNCDHLIYEYFERENPRYDRYWIIEYDTFCSMPLKEFYKDVYDNPVAGSIIVKPWSDEQIPDRGGIMRQWHFFTHNTSPEIYPYLRGILPVCGTMLRRDALFNIVQLWKSVREIDKLNCECRLGTLAAMAGYEPVQIRPDCHKFISFVDVAVRNEPGIYHRCRS